MSCKIYKKMSSVNEMALDNRGRSVLHYLVQPLPSGSFDNYVLLQQLVAIGAPLDQQDKDGKTVLDHAVANGLPKLSLVIQYLMRVDKKQYVSFVCCYLLFVVVVWCCYCCLLLLLLYDVVVVGGPPTTTNGGWTETWMSGILGLEMIVGKGIQIDYKRDV